MDIEEQKEKSCKAHLHTLLSLDASFTFNNENTCLRTLLQHCLNNPDHPFNQTGVFTIQADHIEKKSIKELGGDYAVLMRATQFLFVMYKHVQSQFPYVLWTFKTKNIGQELAEPISRHEEESTRLFSLLRLSSDNEKSKLAPDEWPV